jgi:hypothetical protein
MAKTPSLNRQTVLADANIASLRQARALLQEISDSMYADCPEKMAPHRVGGHLRHILEFYQCFLDGLVSRYIDYDARERDITIETSRTAALAKLDTIIRELQSPTVRSDLVVWVRMEDSEAQDISQPFMTSSVARELQVLSSHTIHHFALIAVTLRHHGLAVSREFGMAPSTLRHLALRKAEAA